MEISRINNNLYSGLGNTSSKAGAVNSDGQFSQVFTTVINGTRFNAANVASTSATDGNPPAAETLQSTTPATKADTLETSSKVVDLDSIFQRAADEYDVPVSLLKAMAKAESNFNTNAVSSCGAMGVMQLMPSTAQALGVADAFDPEQNIMGGAKYISGKLEQYDGNVPLALAAYNAGSGNVKKYGGIPPFTETKNYINKVVGYMGSDISAGSTVVNSYTPQVTGSVNAAIGANTPQSTNADASSSELLSLYSSLLGANSVTGASNSTGNIADMAELISSVTGSPKANASTDTTLASVAEQLMEGGNLSDMSTNLLANANISFDTLASTGLMSDWLAAASLTENEDDGGFSDLINAFNKYNRLTINPIDGLKNNEEA